MKNVFIIELNPRDISEWYFSGCKIEFKDMLRDISFRNF